MSFSNVSISPTILISEFDSKEVILQKIKMLENQAMRSSQFVLMLKEGFLGDIEDTEDDISEEDAPNLFALAQLEEDRAHDQLAKMIHALY